MKDRSPWYLCAWLMEKWRQKPDPDGQMRELDLDVVLDLDIRLYEEKEEMLLKDIYSNSCQITAGEK